MSQENVELARRCYDAFKSLHSDRRHGLDRFQAAGSGHARTLATESSHPGPEETRTGVPGAARKAARPPFRVAVAEGFCTHRGLHPVRLAPRRPER